MALVANAYVSTTSLGDLAACRQELRRLRAALEPRLRANELEGYLALVLEDSTHVEDEGLEPGPIAAAAGERFPLLYVNCTWQGDHDHPPAFLAQLERDHALRPVG